MLLHELRSLEPKRPSDDVRLAVAVDVSGRNAIAVVFVRELNLLEFQLIAARRRAGDESERDDEKPRHATSCVVIGSRL